MNYSSTVIQVIILSFFISLLTASANAIDNLSLASDTPTPVSTAPVWQIGDWWQFVEDYQITLSLGGLIDIPGIVTIHSVYRVTDRGQRTLEKTGDSLDVYELRMSGTVSLSAHDFYSLGMYVYDCYIDNGEYTGEVWIKEDDLSLARRKREIEGTVMVDVGTGFYEFGVLEFAMTEEYAPPVKHFRFPMQVGEIWDSNTTMYAFGAYELLLSDSFDTQSALSLHHEIKALEDVQGLTSYRIHEDVSSASSDPGAFQDYWYHPPAGWLIQQHSEGIDYGGIWFNHLIDVSLLASGDSSIETPTPLPPADTSTPFPTLTPQPTETPTPSATETPTQAPARIALAGWMDTNLTHRSGGDLRLWAILSDELHHEVELGFGGLPTGVYLTQDPVNSELYTFNNSIPPGSPVGPIHVDIYSDGYLSWPYLIVEGSYNSPTSDKKTPTSTTKAYPQSSQFSPPFTRNQIALAGWMNTNLHHQTGGDLKLWALVPDRALHEVELGFYGIPAGIRLQQNEMYPVLYTYEIENLTEIPKRKILFELFCDNKLNWPYLKVVNDPITPTPTPKRTKTPIPTWTVTPYECSIYNPGFTVGLIKCETGCYEGYTLFAPISSKNTYLIDMRGRKVNTWTSNYYPGQTAYLLEDGNLMRSIATSNPRFNIGGTAGGIQLFDWNGTLLWNYKYTNSSHHSHHDIEVLPNGNVLIVAWEVKSQPAALAAGRDPGFLGDGEVWSEHIVEVEPTGMNIGNIVWEWHAWDHLVQNFDATKDNYGIIAAHPELINVNCGMNGRRDWLHINSVDYHEAYDQILLSVHHFNEIWVIDHSTTTIEAADHTGGLSGKGGDLLYRWGNPAAYNCGMEGDRKLYFQHDAHWIATGLRGKGNIMIFDNGLDRPGERYSQVVEITPPMESFAKYAAVTPGTAYGPDDFAWFYTASFPPDFFSATLSSAQRLPNGNTLICEGDNAVFFEINDMDLILWKYINPVTPIGPVRQGDIPNGNAVYRTFRYSPDFPGLIGKDLRPGNYVEKY